MSLPLPVGGFWVSTVTLPVSAKSDDWYGLWAIYDRRPDLEENAARQPLATGTTAAFPDERGADRAAKLTGRRHALAMAS